MVNEEVAINEPSEENEVIEPETEVSKLWFIESDK